MRPVQCWLMLARISHQAGLSLLKDYGYEEVMHKHPKTQRVFIKRLSRLSLVFVSVCLLFTGQVATATATSPAPERRLQIRILRLIP